MPEVIPVGASVTIDVIDAGDLRAGMNLLDSTYLAYGRCLGDSTHLQGRRAGRSLRVPPGGRE